MSCSTTTKAAWLLTDSDAKESPDTAPEGASEIDLITRAQRLLAAQPERAIELLERHEQLYPKGHFGEERDVLWIDALSQLGQSRAVASRARRFLSAYPSSLHRARVQALLGADRAGTQARKER